MERFADARSHLMQPSATIAPWWVSGRTFSSWSGCGRYSAP